MIEKHSAVFSEKTFSKFVNTKRDYSQKSTVQPSSLTKDTVEISVNKSNSNKKRNIIVAIAAAVIAVGVAALAIIKRKNPVTKPEIIEPVLEPIVEPIIDASKKVDLTENEQEKCVQIAKEFLIPTGNRDIGARGICFWGPDSIGKEKAIEDFIKILEDGGYKIDRVPRAGEYDRMKHASIIEQKIKNAYEYFKETGKRTALIVRDMDTIGYDRRGVGNPVVSALMLTEKCDQKGLCWIWEAKNPYNIDPALRRYGRTDGYILALPTEEDSVEIWKGLQNFINGNEMVNPWYHKIVAETIDKLERK